MSSAPRFLNVDLDLFNTRRYDAVVRALTGPSGRAGTMFILHEDVTAFFPVGTKSRSAPKGHAIRLETTRAHKTPAAAIRAIAAAVQALPPRARAEWNGLRFKQLSIGVEQARSAQHAGSCEIQLDARSIALCAAISCQLAIVVYSDHKVR